MDLITQGILGAAIGEAGWRKKLGRGAVFAGIFFGLMPDFDVISSLWGPWTSMVHHRGFTHSVFFAPLVAPLAGYLVWRLSKRRGKPREWMHCIFWALFTHPLLDVFTTYGTQLLTPLSNERFALDGISIVDPLYTLPLLGALILAFVWRKTPRRGQYITAVALVATTCYLGLGYFTGRKARHVVEEQLSPKVELGRVKASATLGNMILWRVMAEDSVGDIHVGLYSTTKDNTIDFVTKKKVESPLIELANEDERVQIFNWTAQDWVGYRIDRSGEKPVLYLDDLRYGGVRDLLDPLWGVRVDFDASGSEVEHVERLRRERDRDFKGELDALWTGITDGPDAIKRDGQPETAESTPGD